MRSISSLNIWQPGDDAYRGYEPLFDDLRDHVGGLSTDEAARISAYMDIFRDKTTVWMSYPSDPFDKNVTVNWNGGQDENFRWSGITHYLIDRYCVDPPNEFRNYVKQQYESGVDLNALAAALKAPKQRRNPQMLREREWRRLKAEGGVKAAWVLYP